MYCNNDSLCDYLLYQTTLCISLIFIQVPNISLSIVGKNIDRQHFAVHPWACAYILGKALVPVLLLNVRETIAWPVICTLSMKQ